MSGWRKEQPLLKMFLCKIELVDIYLRLAFESLCFHGHVLNDITCSYILFLVK